MAALLLLEDGLDHLLMVHVSGGHASLARSVPALCLISYHAATSKAPSNLFSFSGCEPPMQSYSKTKLPTSRAQIFSLSLRGTSGERAAQCSRAMPIVSKTALLSRLSS